MDEMLAAAEDEDVAESPVGNSEVKQLLPTDF